MTPCTLARVARDTLEEGFLAAQWDAAEASILQIPPSSASNGIRAVGVDTIANDDLPLRTDRMGW